MGPHIAGTSPVVITRESGALELGKSCKHDGFPEGNSMDHHEITNRYHEMIATIIHVIIHDSSLLSM